MLKKSIYYFFVMVLVANMAGALSACDNQGKNHHHKNSISIITTGEISRVNDSVVTVRDFDFRLDSAVVSLRGAQGSSRDLHRGMVVTVKGTVSLESHSGQADSIDYQTLATGPITAVYADELRLQLENQVIWLNANTVFQGTNLASLRAGDIIEVNGYLADDGIHATYIRLLPLATGKTVLTGIISNLDTAAMTFTLGQALVDYSAATLGKLPAGGLQNGLLVNVTATRASDRLYASRILVMARPGGAPTPGGGPYPGNDNVSLIDPTSAPPAAAGNGLPSGTPTTLPPAAEKLLLDGFVLAINDDGSLRIGDVLIYTDDATVLNNGGATDLRLGSYLRIEASLTNDGRWLADIITLPIEATAEEPSEPEDANQTGAGVTVSDGENSCDPHQGDAREHDRAQGESSGPRE